MLASSVPCSPVAAEGSWHFLARKPHLWTDATFAGCSCRASRGLKVMRRFSHVMKVYEGRLARAEEALVEGALAHVPMSCDLSFSFPCYSSAASCPNQGELRSWGEAAATQTSGDEAGSVTSWQCRRPQVIHKYRMDVDDDEARARFACV